MAMNKFQHYAIKAMKIVGIVIESIVAVLILSIVLFGGSIHVTVDGINKLFK